MYGAQIRILSVDDHPLVSEGLAAVINREPDMKLVANACNGREAIESFRRLMPDITLMDLRLPDISGTDAMIAIRSEFPEARIIMLTSFEADAEIQGALTAGARSYLLKSMPPKYVLEMIREVHAGKKSIPPEVAVQIAEHISEKPLSGREIEVLRLVAVGAHNRDIAERLSVSEETVKVHMQHIMRKLGAKDRTEATTIAIQRGIIHL